MPTNPKAARRPSARHLALFRRAIDEWDVWRGSMVGNPDIGPLEEHDAAVREARAALANLRQWLKGASE